MREPLRADSFGMRLTPHETAVLERFRSASLPALRFAQIGALQLGERARITAIQSLVRKGILARLGGGGEYWLTDRGLRMLGLPLVA